ncbi:phosphocholine-specific phospholipase C [Sphingobacterium bambusae]|uniref:phospholipase C n=1 Tax=Sphingobacterium bambusae TaxID=662858 RepID=A0ABW6BG32_9SPHI|nr:phospholipase C, phosphocholine-specific [Sphingobacterium bambusae]WPL46949.1 phospholipase C, phosphocholine-specific [Sphingobacterium bambusae]
MENRRSFLKKAALLAGATGVSQFIPSSIQRALAIEAAQGSTFLDAEHIVFLMQENRSFDHCYGTLKGVRGFNDPRAILQPNGLPVWLQQDADKRISTPFRLDLENSKTSWMGSLPHSWKDMVYARNDGKMNTWLEAKKAGNPAYKQLPLTMGYHNREDIPFYYAFADAFTVCDQHFCSSLTGTSANRSYFWSASIREQPHSGASTAHVDNGQINYKNVSWKTYPERLEEANVSWRVYQNELSLPVGFEGEEEDWLANFTDNNLEFHKQYHVRFHPAHHRHMQRQLQEMESALASGQQTTDEERKKWQKEAQQLRADIQAFSPEAFQKLSAFQQAIHQKAFTTNTGDPDYHKLETIRYSDDNGEQEVQVPKGDVFHQFRQDVQSGNLPTVSWLVAPCRFSDHPGSPWYGAWYVSEALDILTADPEVWKKTIFVLTYDENDGYFDHIPPFVPPHSARPESGALPKGMRTENEYVTLEQERQRTGNTGSMLDSPIGLGFRVPLVVASPWSKGGRVNSEVFDLTSPIQFLEYFLQKKYNKNVVEENLSEWRRLICGNLTSVFEPIKAADKVEIAAVDRDEYVERIHSARDKALPSGFTLLDADDVSPENSLDKWWKSPQERGTKQACAIPYDLNVNAHIDRDRHALCVTFAVGKELPRTKEIGVPFFAMSAVPYHGEALPGSTWNFAVRQGEPLAYYWPLDQFAGDTYHIRIYGPNGFYRSFKGSKLWKGATFKIAQMPKSMAITVETSQNQSEIKIDDLSYQQGRKAFRAHSFKWKMDLEKSHGWYDIEISDSADPNFAYQYAGHAENGQSSSTDPLMGGIA